MTANVLQLFLKRTTELYAGGNAASSHTFRSTACFSWQLFTITGHSDSKSSGFSGLSSSHPRQCWACLACLLCLSRSQ